MKEIHKFVLAGVLCGASCLFTYAQELYKNENAPVHERVADLLSRLTVEEKISLLRATSPGIPRLGIDKYYHGNEALHGVVRPGRFTVFPQAIGLAATWNPVLQQKVATVISDEARARWNELDQGRNQKEQFSDVLTFWSPTVNMARDPRWGRTPETYGEDPFLSGVMGTAFVKGLQGEDPRYLKIVSTLSIRWTGKLKPTISGRYTFSFTSDDGCRLRINDQLLIDAWNGHSVAIDSVSIELEAGKEYQLQAEYYDNRDYAIAKLQWKVPQAGKATRLDLYGEAGKAVSECETVVAVMGINKSIEREGQDRYDIQLPADQREFLQEIYKVNPNIIVVLVAGSSLAVNWMDEHIPAIVNAWYPGEQGGTAVADVLFGDYNPAGRLPLTYYKSLDELPPFDDYDITKGRTYKYFKGDVLYPFGYGLSYSSFKYSDLKVKDSTDKVTVSFRLKNTGRRKGDEVAQVYVRIPETGGIVPIKELKGFRRVPLEPGESRAIDIELDKEQLRYWDTTKEQFILPAGTFDVMVGASSKDIRLQTIIKL